MSDACSSAAAHAPLYLVTDKRSDGRVRLLAEYTEPQAALHHARMLRWAGTPAEILVARAMDALEEAT